MNTPPPRVPNAEKTLTYYPAWLKQLQQLADYHGSITDLSTFVALKRGKLMLNTRPTISKIIKGQRTASAEYLLIIQEWMITQPTRTGKK
jgi:hypothetical protein